MSLVVLWYLSRQRSLESADTTDGQMARTDGVLQVRIKLYRASC